MSPLPSATALGDVKSPSWAGQEAIRNYLCKQSRVLQLDGQSLQPHPPGMHQQESHTPPSPTIVLLLLGSEAPVMMPSAARLSLRVKGRLALPLTWDACFLALSSYVLSLARTPGHAGKGFVAMQGLEKAEICMMHAQDQHALTVLSKLRCIEHCNVLRAVRA